MKIPLALLTSFSLIALVAGCSGGSEDSVESPSSGPSSTHLYIGNGAEVRSLDPHFVTDSTGMNVLNSLFDPLVEFNPTSGEFEALACERWEVSEDSLIYTFHLRKDAKWSNGDPVTAADWEAGFKRALKPEVSTPYIQMYRGIVNALEFNEGKVRWEDVGIKAVDTWTFQVSFETPKLSFIGNLSGSSFFPVHRPSMESYGAETSLETSYYRGSDLVSNGPFRFKEWVADQEIVVEANPHYIFADQIHLEKVTYLPIENQDTEIRAFDTHRIHKTSTVPTTKLSHFRVNRTDVLREDDLFGTYFYRFNVSKPPFDDPRVRRALALAINRYEITHFVTNGNQPEATSFVPDGFAGYVGAAGFEENLDEAQALLAEAGYPGGNNFPEITLLYNTSEGHRAIAQAVQEMWRNALGIQVALLNQEWKVFLQTVEDGDFEIARAGWIGGHDPEGYLDLFNSDSGNNHGNYSNPEYDSIFQEASVQADPEIRMELFRKAEAIIVEEMPVIPIYHYKRYYLLRPEVQNWSNNPTASFIFRDVQIGDAAN